MNECLPNLMKTFSYTNYFVGLGTLIIFAGTIAIALTYIRLKLSAEYRAKTDKKLGIVRKEKALTNTMEKTGDQNIKFYTMDNAEIKADTIDNNNTIYRISIFDADKTTISFYPNNQEHAIQLCEALQHCTFDVFN